MHEWLNRLSIAIMGVCPKKVFVTNNSMHAAYKVLAIDFMTSYVGIRMSHTCQLVLSQSIEFPR